MGPIPPLPASSSAGPLAPLLPTPELIRARPERPQPRPVALPSDQVLAISDETRPDRNREIPRTEFRILRGDPSASDDPEKDSSSLPQLDLENRGIRPRNHAVTYRVHPDLPRSLQGNVIDRETSEVLREVPTEDRIQLMKAFREHVGATLDALA